MKMVDLNRLLTALADLRVPTKLAEGDRLASMHAEGWNDAISRLQTVAMRLALDAELTKESS